MLALPPNPLPIDSFRGSLGILLMLSDSGLITLIGAALALYGGYWLFVRCRLLACCLNRHHKAASSSGEPLSLLSCLKELLM